MTYKHGLCRDAILHTANEHKVRRALVRDGEGQGEEIALQWLRRSEMESASQSLNLKKS